MHTTFDFIILTPDHTELDKEKVPSMWMNHSLKYHTSDRFTTNGHFKHQCLIFAQVLTNTILMFVNFPMQANVCVNLFFK